MTFCYNNTKLRNLSQPVLTCSNSRIETQEEYVQSRLKFKDKDIRAASMMLSGVFIVNFEQTV